MHARSIHDLYMIMIGLCFMYSSPVVSCLLHKAALWLMLVAAARSSLHEPALVDASLILRARVGSKRTKTGPKSPVNVHEPYSHKILAL